jgi:hypothetical protein
VGRLRPRPYFDFQVFADSELDRRWIGPPERVAVVADVRSEYATLVFVAPVARRVRLVARLRVLFELEERPPGFVVFPYHLLSGGRSEDAHVPLAVVLGAPHGGVVFREVVLPALAGEFVPQRG